MSYWDTQYKHAEIARTQNKREDRLLQLELDSKHGVKSIHRYNMQAVEHEQRLIERELERIRKGMNKGSLQQSAFRNLGNLSLFSKPKVSPRRPSRLENTVVNAKYAQENLHPSVIENESFKAIVQVEKEADAPYSLADTVADTVPSHLTRSSRIGVVYAEESYTGLALSNGEHAHRTTVVSDRSSRSPKTVVHRKETLGHRKRHLELERSDQSIERITTDRTASSEEVGIPESESNGTKRRPVRTSLDIAKFASLDIQTVKSDVSKRLLQSSKDMSSNDKGEVSAAAPVQDERDAISEVKAKEKSRRTSRTKAPTVDAHKKVMDFDPEHYNPDGSLRKIHAMPSSDQSWEQAKKARYIRSKESVEREKELTVEEIFDKSSSNRPYKY